MKSTKIAKFINGKYIHLSRYGGGSGEVGGGGVIRAIKMIIFRLEIAHLYNSLF